MSKLVMVDTISTFRIRFCVEVEDNIEDALTEVTQKENDSGFHEFSQKHLGMLTCSANEIDKTEYLKLFDEDNAYLSNWDKETKLKFINKINYNK